jgi:DNA invertase Pin-like site-specific DNA recombinase
VARKVKSRSTIAFMSETLVAYFRVSTREQGRSGLGIDAQRAAVARFAAAEGYEIVGEFVEIETGKGADAIERRPQLAAALCTALNGRGIAAAANGPIGVLVLFPLPR